MLVTRKIFTDYVNALNKRAADLWQKGDIKGFCEYYAEDATYVTPKGVVQGRDNILKAFEEAYPEHQTGIMNPIYVDLVEVRFPPRAQKVNMGVAIVCSRVGDFFREVVPAGHSMLTFVLTEDGSGVLIVQDTSTIS